MIESLGHRHNVPVCPEIGQPKVHHDKEHGKTKKMAVSDFSFSKLCHRDFCKTFSEIFNFLTPLHSQNAEEMDFCTLGPLKLCNLWA